MLTLNVWKLNTNKIRYVVNFSKIFHRRTRARTVVVIDRNFFSRQYYTCLRLLSSRVRFYVLYFYHALAALISPHRCIIRIVVRDVSGVSLIYTYTHITHDGVENHGKSGSAWYTYRPRATTLHPVTIILFSALEHWQGAHDLSTLFVSLN